MNECMDPHCQPPSIRRCAHFDGCMAWLMDTSKEPPLAKSWGARYVVGIFPRPGDLGDVMYVGDDEEMAGRTFAQAEIELASR